MSTVGVILYARIFINYLSQLKFYRYDNISLPKYLSHGQSILFNTINNIFNAFYCSYNKHTGTI